MSRYIIFHIIFMDPYIALTIICYKVIPYICAHNALQVSNNIILCIMQVVAQGNTYIILYDIIGQ